MLAATNRADMLDAALVRPGGRLVYATCALERAQNEHVARAFEEQAPSASASAWRTTRPGSVCRRLQVCVECAGRGARPPYGCIGLLNLVCCPLSMLPARTGRFGRHRRTDA